MADPRPLTAFYICKKNYSDLFLSNLKYYYLSVNTLILLTQ